jgi:hypothetical protein
MNYIGDDFSWDKLILICYRGGYGGDFLSNLLQMNYDHNHIFFPIEKNKFESQNALNASEKNFLKAINELYRNYFLLKNNFLLDFKYSRKDYLKELEKSELYNDLENFKKNHIQYIRNIQMKNYEKNFFISTMHYINPLQNFSIHEAFPKSSVFFLYTTDPSKHFLFDFFMRIKNSHLFLYDVNENDTLKLRKKLLEQTSVYFIPKPFDDMIGIDVGKLYFEDGYEDKAEKILSDKLNRKIILDKNLLKEYKKNNMKVLENFFQIENIHKMSTETIIKIIIEDYIIDNNISKNEIKKILKKWKL